MFKLGASYNLFDGEELLEGSINSIKSNVDYISVVYQEVSNLGIKNEIDLIPFLDDLVARNVINEYVIFNPDLTNNSPHKNEIKKRNIGLELSRKNNCTHHISLDADEFFLDDEFKWLKNEVQENDYDSSYCQMLTYYKSTKYIIDPPEEYYISLIFKIKENSSYVLNYLSPVEVDPTRRMDDREKYLVCSRTNIQMHHLSHVRKNYRKKLVNSSAYSSYKNQLEYIYKFYNWWSIEKGNKIFTNNIKYLRVKEVEDIFNYSFDFNSNSKFTIRDKIRYYFSC